MTALQKVSWSRLMLNSSASACKGYKYTSDIKSFDSSKKQNVLNDKKRRLCQSMIPVNAIFWPSYFITFKCPFYASLRLSKLNQGFK